MMSKAHTAAARARQSPWRRLTVALALVLAISLALITATLALALDRSPAFGTPQRLSPAALDAAAKWLKQVDPRSGSPLELVLGRQAGGAAPPLLPAPALQALVQDFSQRMLRVAGGAASGPGPRGGAELRLGQDQAELGLSLPLAATPVARWLPAAALPEAWLNIRATLRAQPEGLPRLQALRVGALPLPVPGWVQDLAWLALREHKGAQRLQMAAQAVQRVQLSPAGLSVQLVPPLQLAERLRRQVLPGVDMAALQAHHAQLAQVLQRPALPPKGALPVSTVLGPMLAFAQAQARVSAREPAAAWRAGPSVGSMIGSTVGGTSGGTVGGTVGGTISSTISSKIGGSFGLTNGSDSGHTSASPTARHNRLALLAVTLYAFKLKPEWLAPQLDWAALPPRDLTLRGRHDHALHYLLSATLVMGANPALADALGLYKELADAGDALGSGFSFDDIAADKAGTALGQRALQQPHKLAQLLPLMIDDVFLMPSVDGLPTGLNAAQFQLQFGDVDSPRFAAQMAEVERRVQALPLLAR